MFQANATCELVQCAYGSGITRESAIAITATALDLATDVLSSNTHILKKISIPLLIFGSRQYPCARPLACENPVWSEARHWCLPLPQYLHDYNCLRQDHRFQSLLPCVLMAHILVASRRVRGSDHGLAYCLSLSLCLARIRSQGKES